MFIIGTLLQILKNKGINQTKIQGIIDKIGANVTGISVGSTNGRFADANKLVSGYEQNIKISMDEDLSENVTQ